MPQKCPYCDFLAVTIRAQVEHMDDKHPEIVHERLRRAGLLDWDEQEAERAIMARERGMTYDEEDE